MYFFSAKPQPGISTFEYCAPYSSAQRLLPDAHTARRPCFTAAPESPPSQQVRQPPLNPGIDSRTLTRRAAFRVLTRPPPGSFSESPVGASASILHVPAPQALRAPPPLDHPPGIYRQVVAERYGQTLRAEALSLICPREVDGRAMEKIRLEIEREEGSPLAPKLSPAIQHRTRWLRSAQG